MRALTPWRPTRVVSTLRVGIVDLLPTSSATGRAGSGSASKAASLQGGSPHHQETSAKRSARSTKEGRAYREVRYGRVECTVRLPGPIDPDSVSARQP